MIYEDQLPEDMTDEEYAKWFNESKVICGVRMGPDLCEFCDRVLPPAAEYAVCDTCRPIMIGLINEPASRVLTVEDAAREQMDALHAHGMDILDRAIDRIEEHSWTQDGPMSDEDDAAIDLLKECREAAERELYAQKEAK